MMNLFCEVINTIQIVLIMLYHKEWCSICKNIISAKTIGEWLDINLKPFNPNSLQNVVLGILTFFIPFAIVFLTDVLNDKNNNKSTFDRVCLNNEVLKTKSVFIASIIGIILFGFGDQTAHIWFKLVAIIFGGSLFLYLYCVFINLLNYSNNQLDFKIKYLNHLKK